MGPFEKKYDFKALSGDEKSPFPINVNRRPTFLQAILGGAPWFGNRKRDDPTTQNIGKSYGPGKTGGKGPGKMKK